MAQGVPDGGSEDGPGVAPLLAWTPWVATAAGASVLVGSEAAVLGVSVDGVALAVGVWAVLVWLGCRWQFSGRARLRAFATVGTVSFGPVLGVTVSAASPTELGWLALAVSVGLALGRWAVGAIARHGGSDRASHLGGFVVFGQSLDALTTAVGVEFLGYGEQTAVSRAILTAAEGLPFTAVTGTSWPFIAIKVGLAVAVVVLFVDVGEEPAVSGLVLALAAFAGFGPAVHNVVLFATT
ncbi:DUF63 family protein [Halobacteriales archaeon Cl-PHB]